MPEALTSSPEMETSPLASIVAPTIEALPFSAVASNAVTTRLESSSVMSDLADIVALAALIVSSDALTASPETETSPVASIIAPTTEASPLSAFASSDATSRFEPSNVIPDWPVTIALAARKAMSEALTSSPKMETSPVASIVAPTAEVLPFSAVAFNAVTTRFESSNVMSDLAATVALVARKAIPEALTSSPETETSPPASIVAPTTEASPPAVKSTVPVVSVTVTDALSRSTEPPAIKVTEFSAVNCALCKSTEPSLDSTRTV